MSSLSNYLQCLSPMRFGSATEGLAQWFYARGYEEISRAVAMSSNANDLQPHLAEVERAMGGDCFVGGVEDAPHEFQQQVLTYRARRGDRVALFDASVIAFDGFLGGCAGESMDLGKPRVHIVDAVDVADPGMRAAHYFLGAVRLGVVEARGHTRKIMRAREEQIAESFKRGARGVWSDAPPFLDKLAGYWTVVNAHRLQMPNLKQVSEDMGRRVAHLTHSLFELAVAGGLHANKLERTLHFHDVEEYIYGSGWLEGYLQYLRDGGHESWYDTLEKKTWAVVNGALHKNDPCYIERTARSFPRVIEPFGDDVDALGRALERGRVS